METEWSYKGVYVKQEVLDEMSKWSPDEGTPQGAVISPLLANIYLHPIDQLDGRFRGRECKCYRIYTINHE